MHSFSKSLGFTLIELLGIIVVLTLIFMFSFANLSNTTKKNKENEYNMFVKDLCLAGQNYVYSNLEKYPEVSNKKTKLNVKVSDLINEGIIEKNVINPKTKQNPNNSFLVYTVLDDYTLDCEYRD